MYNNNVKYYDKKVHMGIDINFSQLLKIYPQTFMIELLLPVDNCHGHADNLSMVRNNEVLSYGA